MRDDDLRQLFAPLRTARTPTDAELARVRAADRSEPRMRRRWVISGTTAVAAGVVAVVAATVIDRGHPGTFVGEAGARELLRAAADATRDDPVPTGWRLTTTLRVQRLALEGRPCKTCPVERALLETSSAEDLWSGPRGEAYTGYRQDPARAIENEPLLRAKHALDPPVRAPEVLGSHVIPAPKGSDDRDSPMGLGIPGTIADPAAVPDDPGGMVRFVTRRLADQDRALRAQQRSQGGGTFQFDVSHGTRVTYTLVDLATSPQLSGAQKAAAFEAIAERGGVTAVPAPAAFASPDRVAVRIAARIPSGRPAMRPGGVPDRVIVFDRASHRVVAAQAEGTKGDPRTTYQFGEGPTRRSMRQVAEGGGETRYDESVDVPGPGLDADGRRRLDMTRLAEIGRDGQSVGYRPPTRRAAHAAARRGAAARVARDNAAVRAARRKAAARASTDRK